MMISIEQLEEMSRIDISLVNLEELKELKEIVIDEKLNETERVVDYIEKNGNPYAYRYGDYKVKIEFDNESNDTLSSLLNELMTKVAEGVGI